MSRIHFRKFAYINECMKNGFSPSLFFNPTLTLMVRGEHIVPALFSDAYFSLKLKCWRAQISRLFPYAYGEPPYILLEAPNGLKWGF